MVKLLAILLLAIQPTTPIQQLQAIAKAWQADDTEYAYRIKFRRHHIPNYCVTGANGDQSCSGFRDATPAEMMTEYNKRDAQFAKERTKANAAINEICSSARCKFIPSGAYNVEQLKLFLNQHE